MHFSTILSLGLAAVAAAAPLADESPLSPEDRELIRRQFPVMPCSHLTGGLHLLALGGANTDNPKDYGYLSTLASSILSAIPGSTNVSVPYNKILQPTNPPSLQPGAITAGMATFKKYIVEYHYACPNTKMAIIGYSSGAIIAMNDLCYGGDGVKTPQINPLLAGKYIVGTVVYGDETRTMGQPYDLGTCTNYQGVRPRTNPSLCYPFANSMQSYCDLMDQDCCVGSGYDPTVHFSYPQKYDAAATQFIVNAFNAAGGA